jgi:hypothetical protein
MLTASIRLPLASGVTLILAIDFRSNVTISAVIPVFAVASRNSLL